MLVVLGSRLAISCGQSIKLLPAAQEAFTEMITIALGRSSVFRGQLTYKFREPERSSGKNNLEKLLTLTLSYLI